MVLCVHYDAHDSQVAVPLLICGNHISGSVLGRTVVEHVFNAQIAPRTGTIRLKVSASVESIVEMWPNEEDHKVMAEFRKQIKSSSLERTTTLKAKRQGDKLSASKTADEWQKSLLERKDWRCDEMTAKRPTNLKKYLATGMDKVGR